MAIGTIVLSQFEILTRGVKFQKVDLENEGSTGGEEWMLSIKLEILITYW